MSTIKRFFWKVWLKLNILTDKTDNDYVAEVSTAKKKPIRNTDIAQIIKERGSEMDYNTIVDILNRADAIVREQVQREHSIQTGVVHIIPRVKGPWFGISAKYDPEIHKTTLDMIPAPEMRRALEEVGIEVLGVKNSGAVIGLVTDAATGKTDGTITPLDQIIIEGTKIKIAPEDEEGLGVFFVNEDGLAVQSAHRLLQNDPKKVIAQVPGLTAAQYTLRIITRYSNGTVSLKEPRTINYEYPLKVLSE
jgi:hypothetical protein